MFDKDIDETKAADAGAAIAVGGAMPVDLARLGLTEIAYIRRALVNGEPMWTIHSAAGDPLGAAPSFDLAWSR